VALKNIKQHEKNPSEETITEIRTPNTNSSVMTDDKSAAMIADFQNTKNQIDRKSTIQLSNYKNTECLSDIEEPKKYVVFPKKNIWIIQIIPIFAAYYWKQQCRHNKTGVYLTLCS
jgi:hypothetical protein